MFPSSEDRLSEGCILRPACPGEPLLAQVPQEKPVVRVGEGRLPYPAEVGEMLPPRFLRLPERVTALTLGHAACFQWGDYVWGSPDSPRVCGWFGVPDRAAVVTLGSQAGSVTFLGIERGIFGSRISGL